MGLYVDSLYVTKRRLRILNNIYLEVNMGEVVGVLGRNGSGKSTLFKCIFGLMKPDNAFMKIDGRHFARGYSTGKMSFLPQQEFLPRDIKLATLVSCFKDVEPAFFDIPVVKESLKFKIQQLSGGSGRLIETLLILYTASRYKILDEPFTNLSPLNAELVMEHIEIVRHRCGVLISDHRYDDVLRISDRLYYMETGNIRAIEGKDDLIEHHYIR